MDIDIYVMVVIFMVKKPLIEIRSKDHISRVSCQKGPTRHAYEWQIGPFSQGTLELWLKCSKL